MSRVAHEKRQAYAHEEYWGRPVPSFGDTNVRLLVLGLGGPASQLPLCQLEFRLGAPSMCGPFYPTSVRSEVAILAVADSQIDRRQRARSLGWE